MHSEATPTVTVVVMAYNERPSLEPVVRELEEALHQTGQAFEILIIDDGSSDGTEQVADQLMETIPHVRVIHHPLNGGLGQVYRTGFAEARGDWVTFFPADGQFPAAILHQFLPLIASHDLVLGYLPERRASALPRLLSGAERVLYRCLFGKLPRMQGVLMFRRQLLHGMTLHSRGRGWAVLMEFILRVSRQGRRIISVPTSCRPRMCGQSKVNNLRTVWANLRQVLTLWLVLSEPEA